MLPVAYTLRSLSARRTTALSAALGIALVVFVLSAAAMLARGVEVTLARTGRPERAIVLRLGSDSELSSTIDAELVERVLDGPHVRRAGDGALLGAGEVLVVVALERLGGGGESNVQVRGLDARSFAVRGGVEIIAGRAARPGTDEAIVGHRLRGRFRGTEIGESVELAPHRSVTVVGAFTDGGSALESEVWADIETVRSSSGRAGLVSSVRVVLDSPAAYADFAAWLGRDRALGVVPLREDVYYERQSSQTALFVRALGWLLGGLFTIAACLGAMVTMHASVAERRFEIATLRALGFSRGAVLASFLLEAWALAALGGALGASASLALGWVRLSAVNIASWSEVVFSFAPTPLMLLGAAMGGGLMGLAGGLVPAIAATRVSPAHAMRR